MLLTNFKTKGQGFLLVFLWSLLFFTVGTERVRATEFFVFPPISDRLITDSLNGLPNQYFIHDLANKVRERGFVLVAAIEIVQRVVPPNPVDPRRSLPEWRCYEDPNWNLNPQYGLPISFDDAGTHVREPVIIRVGFVLDIQPAEPAANNEATDYRVLQGLITYNPFYPHEIAGLPLMRRRQLFYQMAPKEGAATAAVTVPAAAPRLSRLPGLTEIDLQRALAAWRGAGNWWQ